MKTIFKRTLLLLLASFYLVASLATAFAADAPEGDAAALCQTCAEENAELTEPLDKRDGAEDYRKWSQSDARWGSLPLGSSGGTVAGYGCTVTSVTKLIIQCGLRSPESFDVGTLVRWLNQNGGFTSKGALYWGKPSACVSGFTNYGDILSYGTYSATTYNDKIIAWIKAGYHMTIQVRNGGHWVAVDEEKSLATGTVYIMDSSSSLANADITLASRYASFNTIHAYKGGKIAAPPHTCDMKGGYAFIESTHPHYKCYYCSVCGVAQRNYDEPTVREGCLECNRPDAPVLLGMKEVYHPGEAVVLTWEPTKNTTHYNLYLDQLDENGAYQRVNKQHYAESGFSWTLAEGRYRVLLQSTNKNFYEEDGKNWLYKDGAWVEFDVAHTYVPIVTAPTCTEQGYTTYTCAICSDSYVADRVNALDHDMVNDPAVPATCTETGLTEGSHCSRCDYTVAQKVTAALGHTWDDGKVTTAPTAEREGVKTYTCTRCGETRTEPVDKLPFAFGDVPADAYYAAAVNWAVAQNVTNGTSATTFSPDDTCTRGQIVTFLWRAAGQPTPAGTKNPFSDVKESAYYYNAVLWAVEQGITAGTSETTFSPNDGCTRGQVATFLWRYEGKPAATGNNPFTDVKAGAYYYDAVLWAVANGITNGTSPTTFEPDTTCTRGQIVTFLYRDLVK